MKKFIIDQIRKEKIHLNEGFISLFFHFLKSLLVLYINWIILNKLSNNDYVIWSVTSSILMIATASDLGIGQHTVAVLIQAEKEQRKSIIINACIALIPLFLVAFFFVILSLSGTGYYVFLMALFVSLRLFSIPFGAFLNATNNFKARKIVEFFTYFIAAVAISIIVFVTRDVNLSLLALNISFIIGSVIIIYLTLNKIPNGKIVIDRKIFSTIFSIMQGSLPFLVNNLTALLTYGGFIWISSFVLPGVLIAKLSVLHSFLFMTLYQIYDVFLRSKQADLIIAARIHFFLKLNRIVIFGIPVFILAFGFLFLKIIAPNLNFDILELLFFSIFIVIEFCYLIIQSIIQVDFKLARGLFFYSIVRLVAILVAFATYFFLGRYVNLTFFLLLLSLFSLFGLLFSNYYFNLKTKFSLWG